MSSDQSKIQYNTRERLTSGDLNGNIAYGNAALQDAMSAIAGPDIVQSGVLTGFQVNADSGDRSVTINAGLGLMEDSTAAPPDSTHRWMQLFAGVTLPVAAATGDPRWDVIEVAPGTVVESTDVRDEWDPSLPPSGGFSPQVFDKVIESAPVLTIRVGADNSPNPPNFPAGIPGVMPLAYIFVSATGVISDGRDGIVMCRPILRAPGSADAFLTPYITGTTGPLNPNGLGTAVGGGINVDTTSQSAFAFAVCQGRFRGHSFGFSVGWQSGMTAADVEGWDGGVLPVSDRAVYAYAVQPPYPLGYGTVFAPRELQMGADVETHFKTTSRDRRNCVTVLSSSEPVLSSGVQGSSTGTGSIADWPFRDGVILPDSQRSEWIYLGAVDFDESQPAFMSQNLTGATINLNERFPATDFVDSGDTQFSLVSSDYPVAPPAEFLGFIPNHVREVFGKIVYQPLNGGVPPSQTVFEANLRDAENSSGDEGKSRQEYNLEAFPTLKSWAFRMKTLFGTSVVGSFLPDATALTICRWESNAYVDPILAMR